MEELFEKLHKLQNISSTNSKKQFIKANKDDKLFLNTLEFLLNPYKVTNISKKKIEKQVSECNLAFNSLEDFYDYLVNKSTGKDVDIAIVQRYIENHKEFETELKELATKSMRLGVKGKLVNQALRYDLIHEFGCMLGESYFKNENKVRGSFILTTKLDGSRILILKENGKVSCCSRQGQLIDGLDDIVSEVEQMNFDNGVIDGELVAIGEFKDSADMYKETMKRSRIKGIKSGLKVMAYDYIQNIDDFYKGLDTAPCLERKIKLERLIKESNCRYVEYLKPLYIGTDKREIWTQLQIAKDKNEEGIMLNIANAKYECKRSKNLLKCKLMSSCDVKVVDLIEGEGKNKDKLGAITVEFEHEGKLYQCNVGSGLSDEQRVTYWEDKSLLMGKIIEVNYFEISKNEQGTYGLRFGVFKGIRNDKDEISMH